MEASKCKCPKVQSFAACLVARSPWEPRQRAAWLHAAAASSILTSMHSEVTHREHGCGVVQHIEKISHNGTSRGFSVIFGDGTRSQPQAQVSCCDRPFMSPES